MTAKSFNPENARLIVTSGGHFAVECDDLSAREQADLLGPSGIMPPQSLTSMVDELLEMLLAAPDSTDAARLRSLADDLIASHAKVEIALAKLEQG